MQTEITGTATATAEPPSRLMTTDAFCKSYSMSLSKAYNLMRSGKIQSVIIGRQRLIVRASVEELITASKYTPMAKPPQNHPPKRTKKANPVEEVSAAQL